MLVKSIGFLDNFNGDFTVSDGGSHVNVPAGTAVLRIATEAGMFEIHPNASGEMALVSMRIDACDAIEARNLVQNATAPVLDHISFMGGTPIITGLTRIYDDTNQASTLDLIAPEQAVTLNPGNGTLFADLAPIYALYREFKNTVSPFYRLLCAYKILEGIYGVLRKSARKRATEKGIRLIIPKEVVPDHPDIAKDLRHLVGKPIKTVCDNVLQKRYRDAAAHFLVQETQVLRVSSAEERAKFADMAFLCDLCAQIVIHNHEAALRHLK
ncbi:methylamine utilization protein MauJ [Shinella sp.]